MKWWLVLTIKHSGTSSSPHFLRRKEASHDQVSWPWQKAWGRKLLLVGKTRESSEKQLFKVIYTIGPNVTLGYTEPTGFSLFSLRSLYFFFFFFNEKNYLFIYFWLHWAFVAAQGLSPAAASRVYSLVVVWELLVVVSSLVAEHRLSNTGLAVVGHGLSCFMACGIFLDQGSNQCSLRCNC